MTQLPQALLVAHRGGRHGARARRRRQRHRPAEDRRRPARRVAVMGHPHFLAKGATSTPHLLKSDVFGTHHAASATPSCATRARARPWARALALHLMRREHRALIAPRAGRRHRRRSARRRVSRPACSRAAGSKARPCSSRSRATPPTSAPRRGCVRRLHAANVIHNDLAKETNWLVTPDGRPALVDFQLAMTLDEARRPRPRARPRRHPPPAQAQAHLSPRAPHRAREAHPRDAVAASRGSGWPAARRSIYSSRAGSSAGAIARARAIAWRDTLQPEGVRHEN